MVQDAVTRATAANLKNKLETGNFTLIYSSNKKHIAINIKLLKIVYKVANLKKKIET